MRLLIWSHPEEKYCIATKDYYTIRKSEVIKDNFLLLSLENCISTTPIGRNNSEMRMYIYLRPRGVTNRGWLIFHEGSFNSHHKYVRTRRTETRGRGVTFFDNHGYTTMTFTEYFQRTLLSSHQAPRHSLYDQTFQEINENCFRLYINTFVIFPIGEYSKEVFKIFNCT